MDKDSRKKYGFALAGVSGLLWGYLEYQSNAFPSHIRKLKHSIQVPMSYSKSNDGKLVYISGPITNTSSSSLQDDLFRVSVQGLKLRRKVEMFQWVQDKNSSMQLKWSSSPINSSNFDPQFNNPKWKIFDLDLTANGPFKVLDYKIGNDVIRQLKSWKVVQGEYQGNEFKQERVQEKIVLYKSKKKFSIPKVGNYRISHEYIPSGIYLSVVGQQRGDSIKPYNGMLLVKEGIVKPETLIDDYANSYKSSIWKYRIACFLGVTIGLKLGFS